MIWYNYAWLKYLLVNIYRERIALMENNIRDKSRFYSAISSPFILGLILLLAAGLRLYNLGKRSYWIDEIASLFEGRQTIQQVFASGRLDQPPGFYLFYHLWLQAFGSSEFATRLFSTLAGLGSIVLIYLIGRNLFGKGIGLLSALLMAVSVFQIQYSQEARFYSFYEFATLLSFLFFILALKSGKLIHLVFYGLATILMVSSQAYGIFVLAAQYLFFILRLNKYKEKWVTWAICQVLILIALVPYFYPFLYPFIFSNSGTGNSFTSEVGNLSRPSIMSPFRTIYQFIMPARMDQSWITVFAGYTIGGLFLLMGVWIYAHRQGESNWTAGLDAFFTNLKRMPTQTNADNFILLACWLLCPIIIIFVLSLIVAPVYLDRYMIGSAPALYLLLAFVLFSIRNVIPLVVSLGTLMIALIPGTRYYYITDFNEQWRQAAAYVAENSRPNDSLVFVPNWGAQVQQKSFDWYYHGVPLPGCGIGNKDSFIDPSEYSTAIMQCTAGTDRFWIIRSDRSDELTQFGEYLLTPSQSGLTLIKEEEFVGITVDLFERTK
jgi:mannosyltransferase